MTATQVRAGTHAQIAPRRAIAAVVLFAVGLVLFGQALAESVVPTHAVVWGSLALTSYAIGLLCLAGGREATGLGLANWKLGPGC